MRGLMNVYIVKKEWDKGGEEIYKGKKYTTKSKTRFANNSFLMDSWANGQFFSYILRKVMFAQKLVSIFSSYINWFNEKYYLFLLTLYCLCLWIFKAQQTRAIQIKTKPVNLVISVWLEGGRRWIGHSFFQERRGRRTEKLEVRREKTNTSTQSDKSRSMPFSLQN